MFPSIVVRALPETALLQRYVESGDYTDCFSTDVNTDVTFTQYVEAFYTTTPFQMERLVLKWLASRPSTDDDVRRLANGSADTFAAWDVEERADRQLLLCDLRGRTRSWLMLATGDGSSRLYFGSAVIRTEETSAGRRLSWVYQSLLGFHRLYSRILLSAARWRLRQN